MGYSVTHAELNMASIIAGVLLTLYFSVREIIQMYNARAEEIISYTYHQKGSKDKRVVVYKGDVVRVINEDNLVVGHEGMVLNPHHNGMVQVELSTKHLQQDDRVRDFNVHEIEVVEQHTEQAEKHRADTIEVLTSKERLSRFITLYLGISVSYRNDPFNCVDVLATTCSWLTFGALFAEAIGLVSHDYYRNMHVDTLYITTVFLFGIKFLGFIRGTGIRMATFIIMVRKQ